MIARCAKASSASLLAILVCVGCEAPKAGLSAAKDTQSASPLTADWGLSEKYGEPKKTWCDDRPVEVEGEDFADGTPRYRNEVVMNEEGEFVSHGTSTVWWENGQKKLELHYVCGLRHGPKRTWWQDGNPWSVGGFYNGQDHGTWTTWDGDGGKSREYSLVRGKWQGFFTTWYPNGQKKMQVEFVDGRQQGLMTIWDEQGNILSAVEYLDGHEQPMPG